MNIENILSFEINKTWQTVFEMVKDKSELKVLLLPNDFHNLKVCIKALITEKTASDFFIPFGTIDPKMIFDAVENKNYDLLPEYMRAVANKAFEVFLHTADSQVCDTLIDNCLLRKMEEISLNSKLEIEREYAELFVAVANIKVAVRACKTNKKIKFLNMAMVNCKSLNIDELKKATLSGIDKLYEYLLKTPYDDAVPYLKTSMALFEKWYDDKIVDLIKKEKSNPFTLAPIIAYVLARQNEIKVIRIIFSGKRNKISDDMIRERLRCMYV